MGPPARRVGGLLICSFDRRDSYSIAELAVAHQHHLGLLHDQVTVSVTRPDWPVWS